MDKIPDWFVKKKNTEDVVAFSDKECLQQRQLLSSAPLTLQGIEILLPSETLKIHPDEDPPYRRLAYRKKAT